jgi:membrane-bound serine protease (ClpP class)
VEVLLIPGFGIAGISGIGIILWGLYELLLPDVPVGQEIHSMAITGLTIGIIGGIIGLILLFKLMTKTEFWLKLTSPTVQKKDEGYNSSIGLEDLIEQKGVADTDLRPSGWINVGNQRIFVVTEGSYIDQNDNVIILSVDGNRVVVRKIK